MHSQNVPTKFSPHEGNALRHTDGIIRTGDYWRNTFPVTGWRYNPWTGAERLIGDRAHDPMGLKIVPPCEEPAPKVVYHQMPESGDDAQETLTVRQVKFGPPTRNNPVAAPKFYEVVISRGEEKHTLTGTDKNTLAHLCAEVLKGMK